MVQVKLKFKAQRQVLAIVLLENIGLSLIKKGDSVIKAGKDVLPVEGFEEAGEGFLPSLIEESNIVLLELPELSVDNCKIYERWQGFAVNLMDECVKHNVPFKKVGDYELRNYPIYETGECPEVSKAFTFVALELNHFI